MDGLNISNAVNSDLLTARTGTSQSRTSELKSTNGEGSFAQSLKDAVNSVNSLQKDADLKMEQLATGQNTNIHETMIATEKADIALRMMVQVRNKIIEAYQEVMRMQV